ncbi:MAG: FAD synthase [Candidatus Thermoplasmatota archaeon]|nr:FAD synthase [Candidatus Thermoplasmatota archaeon]
MTRVMATGVFDILHLGHIHFLKEIVHVREELVVVVARDSTAGKRGKTPVFNESARLQLVNELKLVDRAILGHEGDIYSTVEEVKPDIITLGYDQSFDPDDIKRKCSEMGLNVRVVRISRYSNSTYKGSSEIKEKLLQIIEDRI